MVKPLTNENELQNLEDLPPEQLRPEFLEQIALSWSNSLLFSAISLSFVSIFSYLSSSIDFNISLCLFSRSFIFKESSSNHQKHIFYIASFPFLYNYLN